jgi:hypothetical protein
MQRRRGRCLVIAATLSAVALVAAGCGRSDFKNDPAPPVPLEVTVEINDSAIKVSPPAFGAGLVNFVIANNARDAAVFQVNGPTRVSSESIPVNGNTVFKTPMEQGDYTATVQGNPQIQPTKVRVGPQRASSSNTLLLP